MPQKTNIGVLCIDICSFTRSKSTVFVVDMFVQYCYFLKQVGQLEKAVASFQALIEYNLYSPEVLHEEKVVIFESFWDSGVPRVGEQGAKGWSYWYTNKTLEPIPRLPPQGITTKLYPKS